MFAHLRRHFMTAALAACLAASLLTGACGAGLAGNQANPGGVQTAKDAGTGAKPGESAGTGGGIAARETAGALGTPIPTPGQTGSAAGKPSGSPSPSPSPSGR